jgi:hypothetical protein
MEIRITIDEHAAVEAEFVSILEDLHHDFEYFTRRAERLQTSLKATRRWFVAKRYERAALLALMSYLEGVVNQWLQSLLAPREWKVVQKKLALHEKCERLVQSISTGSRSALDIRTAKDLRNRIVHLRPGSDLAIYDELSVDLLRQTAENINVWLRMIEAATGFRRHPNTKEESDRFWAELGKITGEAGSA